MIKEEILVLEEQVNDLTKRLAEAEAFKSHFLSNIRNALTNPFTSIVGLSEEIIRSEKEAWKKVIMMASLIHNEAFDLDFQLNNIFCAAELESGELYPETVKTDIGKLISKIINKYRVRIQRKDIKVGLNFDFHEFGTQSDYFITDPKFIELIIMNLFDNAVKFTGKNGSIQVQVSRRDGVLTVMVRDNGKGMDQADYTRIFDRFKRLERNINSLESGHGLGLSIVKLLVEMLQGDLHMDSQPGSGTTFTCIIPEMISETQVESVSTEGNEFLFLSEEVF